MSTKRHTQEIMNSFIPNCQYGKQSKYLTTVECITKLWFIHTVEYYTEI